MIKYAAPYHPTAQFRPEYGFVAGWVDVNTLFFKDSIGFRVGFDGKVGIVKGEDIKGFGGIATVDSLDEFGYSPHLNQP